MQPDTDTATREHVIEVSLPKISSIGHVEVRFSLRATANDVPDVKVALLYYKTDGRVGDVSISTYASLPLPYCLCVILFALSSSRWRHW